MSNIVKFKLSGLWNSEYPLVVNRMIDMVSAHKPEELHFGNNFNILAAFRPQLDKIEVQEKFDKDSIALSELDQRRDTLFSVIYTVAKAFRRTPIAEISNHADSIMAVLKKHGSGIASANYTAETERLNNLLADLGKHPELLKPLEALSLLQLFVLLEKSNTDFDKLFMQRNQQQAETERVDVRAVRTECDKVVTQLWNAIEFCCHEYGKEKYLPLISEINNFNSYYKQQLAARATRRKAKQDLSTEEPIEPVTA